MKKMKAVSAVLGLLVLASCATAKIDPTIGGGGITGKWAPDGGGYTALFNNGQFSTTAEDTGNIISQGSYIAVSTTEVTLKWTSNVTGLENTATCQRPDPVVLNCTDGGGKSFTLRKLAA
ncbi:MAG: hypothetical protein ACR2O0_10835 [Rhizobiaceae bacterium]